jgi:O-antigen ligase
MASARQFGVSIGAYPLSAANATPYPFIERLALAGIAAMICLSVTTPVITISDNLPWVKVEQLLLPVVFVIFGWMALTGFARLIRFNGMFVVGAVQCSCILLSLVYGAAFLQHRVLWRDFFEIPKALLPVIYFTVAYEAELSERSLRRLLGYFSVAALLVCFYAWAQWMSLGFTYTLNAIYTKGLHDDALFGVRRVYATFGNANVLAQFMDWAFVAFTLAAFARVGSRLRNGALVLACVVTLAMTGSRYGLLVAGLCVVLLLSLPSQSQHDRGKRFGIFLALIPVVGLTIWMVASSNTGTLRRYQTLSNPAQTDSVRQRVNELWRDAGEQFLISPFFGHGPAKSIYTGIITDSEYLVILKEFGLLGLLCYLMYFLVPLTILWRGLQNGRRAGPWLEQAIPANFLTLRLSFIMVITALVMNVGMSTYLNMLLQGYLWLWLGLGAQAARNIQAADSTLERTRY